MPLVVSFRGDGPLRSTRTSQRRFATGKAVSSVHKSVVVVDKSVAALKAPSPDAYLCDFYDNIWYAPENEAQVMTRVATATGVRTQRRRRNPSKVRLVDVAQVSYVLTTVLDFRGEYPSFTNEHINIWGTPGKSGNYIDDEGDDSAPDIVSPIQSQQPMRFPKSAPQFRTSTITEGDAFTEADDDDEEEEAVNDDDVESSFVSSSAIPGELRRVRSQVVTPSGTKSKDRATASLSVSAMLAPPLEAAEEPVAAPPLSEDLAIPPPSAQNGSVIFSSVFHRTNDWSWSIRFLLGVHEPIRHALFVMDRFLEQSQLQQQVAQLEFHTSEFFAWFKTYFVEYLKSQHEVKVKVLLPLVKLKYSTKQEILRTYDDIYGLLAQIQQQEQGLVAPQGGGGRAPVVRTLDRPGWLVRLDALQKSIRRLNMALHVVLNLEEKSLHTAMACAFSEETFKSHIMPRLFRAIKAKKVVVPWIVERSKVWGGEAEQQSFQGMMPLTSRFMYKKIWRPYFMSNVAVAMNHLNEFELASAAHAPERRDVGCVMQ